MERIKQILLAEDSSQDVELTLDALREYRLANDVVVVQDGQEALDFLTREGAFAGRKTPDPGLVLLDLKMPKLSGLDVLSVIKKDPGLRTIPVVVLTSSREEPDLQAAYDLGVNAYVVKPVDFPGFMEAVRKIGQFWITLNENPPQGTAGGKGGRLG